MWEGVKVKILYSLFDADFVFSGSIENKWEVMGKKASTRNLKKNPGSVVFQEANCADNNLAQTMRRIGVQMTDLSMAMSAEVGVVLLFLACF